LFSEEEKEVKRSAAFGS